MEWYGCRGCGWITKDIGAVHVNGRCQFCNHPKVSRFSGTQEEYDHMIAIGLTMDSPKADTHSW